MSRARRLKALAGDQSGGTLVEFALLAPVFISMMLGILAIGIAMRDYNMLRSVSADVGRYAIVEYQKSNQLDADQIEAVAASIAGKPPYGFVVDNLEVEVEDGTSVVAGARKLELRFGYRPITVMDAYGLSAPQLSYTQNIYVPVTPLD